MVDIALAQQVFEQMDFLTADALGSIAFLSLCLIADLCFFLYFI